PPATTSTPSLHDALPIEHTSIRFATPGDSDLTGRRETDERRDVDPLAAGGRFDTGRDETALRFHRGTRPAGERRTQRFSALREGDRKSTLLNSSHVKISY